MENEGHKIVIELKEGERISRNKIALLTAKLYSLRSTCERGRNGAVITKNNRIISTGYNGPIFKNTTCKESCDTSNKCVHSVHAEANAICAAAKEGIELEGSVIYCTSSPCIDCAKLIIQSGISVVVYENEYTTDNGLGIELLRQNKIEVYKS